LEAAVECAGAGFDRVCFERFACRLPEMFRDAADMATKADKYKVSGQSANAANALKKR
jgi:hypothetical protein